MDNVFFRQIPREREKSGEEGEEGAERESRKMEHNSNASKTDEEKLKITLYKY